MFDKIIFGPAAQIAMTSYFELKQEQYVTHMFKFHESDWLEKYAIIRDVSWPTLTCYQDFYSLPQHIQDECIQLHKFSPNIWRQQIKKDSDHDYQIKEAIDLEQSQHQGPLYKFFSENNHIINGKKIIDVGCNFGYWSIFAAKNQAEHVVGFDARSELISISQGLQQDYDVLPNKLSFRVGTVHDYEFLRKVSSDRQTVLLLGIIYHVHDHVKIIESLISDTTLDVVIETVEPIAIETEQPFIWWMKESTSWYMNGVEDDKKTILVGWPNMYWFDLIFAHYGFNRQITDVYDSKYATADHPRKRRLIHYKRNKVDNKIQSTRQEI